MSSVFDVTTLLWLLGAGLVTGVLVLMLARNARPTRSIASVLYDVENPGAKR